MSGDYLKGLFEAAQGGTLSLGVIDDFDHLCPRMNPPADIPLSRR